MAITPRERFYQAMHCEDTDRPPVCGMTTTGTMELMEYTGAFWPEAHKSGKQMAKIALGAYPFFGLESIRVPYCLTYEAEALGCKIALGKRNSTPMVRSNPFKDNPDAALEMMTEEEMVKLPRISEIIKSAQIISENRGQGTDHELPTLLGVTGPFTITGHLVGAENLMMWTLTEPAMVEKFTGYASDFEKMWLQYVEDNLCIDSVQMSEPTASYDMISPEFFDKYAVANLRKVYKPLKKTMAILHICGNMLPMLNNMIASGCTACSLEEKTDSAAAVKLADKRAALVGNVGVVPHLLMGTPEKVKEAAIHSADAGFNIISAGCGLSALIKKENLRAMVEAIVNYKRP